LTELGILSSNSVKAIAEAYVATLLGIKLLAILL
jgi:hypothetical protein